MLEGLRDGILWADTFEGAFLDTGAERAVIGRCQAAAYARWAGTDLTFSTPDGATFCFGGKSYQSRGVAHIRMPIANSLYLPLDVDVVDLDVPFLLGLHVLDALKMYINSVSNELICVAYNVVMPIVRRHGHAYLVRGEDTLYAMVELKMQHSHICHPHPDRLFAVLRRGKDFNATKENRERLEDVTANCDTCQRLAMTPSRFQLSLSSEDLVFN